MNIRDFVQYQSTFWDWTFLNGCFGNTHIRITDVDGLIERRGCFLLIETKLPGNEVPRGQQILLDAWVKIPKCNAIVLWGRNSIPEEYEIWGNGKGRKSTNLKDFQWLISKWFEQAENGTIK